MDAAFSPEHELVLYDIHQELRESIHPKLDPAWELNEALLHWMHAIPRSSATQRLTVSHFARLSIWIEARLLTQSVLPSKAALAEKLREIEEALHITARPGPTLTHPLLLTTHLGILALTPGVENIPIVKLAEGLLWLLEESRVAMESAFPESLVPSVAAIASHSAARAVAPRPRTRSVTSAPPPAREDDPLPMDAFGEMRRRRRSN